MDHKKCHQLIHFSSVMFKTIQLKQLLGNSPFNSKLNILGDFEIFLTLFQENKIRTLNCTKITIYLQLKKSLESLKLLHNLTRKNKA